MCGIAGEFRFDNQDARIEAVAAMTAAQAPRGPDAQGLWAQGGAAFGHRRLRIIDLSAHGAQPMVDSHLGLTVAFNGMIYNYRDLRQRLEAEGYAFFSTSDTEVMLKAYHRWGGEAPQYLQGMFAFAIAERDSGRLILGRDRLGIKPLYYAPIPGGLRFASTLPALLATSDIDRRLDPVALNYYLSFHAVVPAPYTIVAGVRKLPPATLRVYEPDGRLADHRYWQLTMGPQPGDEAISDAEWEERVGAALSTAVERRMIADVPVGVLLSGGLDSSLIVGLLARNGQHDLKTFSIGFERAGGETGDEFEYSDVIARHFGTEHHRIPIDGSETLAELPRAIRAMSEPMVSHDAIGFYLLAREVSKQVRVVQSGQGADEVFAGYHWYPPLADSADPVATYAAHFRDRDPQELAAALMPDWTTPDYAGELIRDAFSGQGHADPVARALWLDTHVMLVDDPVKRVDNMTMAWGLEARVPFLDHELVELAARVPSRLKTSEDGKGVLKRFARRVIPSEVIDRPKGYFPVPSLKYLQGPFLEWVRDGLNSRVARDRGLFRRDYLDTLLAAPDQHIAPLGGAKLWQLGLLELWLQEQGL